MPDSVDFELRILSIRGAQCLIESAFGAFTVCLRSLSSDTCALILRLKHANSIRFMLACIHKRFMRIRHKQDQMTSNSLTRFNRRIEIASNLNFFLFFKEFTDLFAHDYFY